MKSATFLYDVYGRLKIEVICNGMARTAYRIMLGKRELEPDFAIPEGSTADEIRIFLDDMFHELSQPGQDVRLIQSSESPSLPTHPAP